MFTRKLTHSIAPPLQVGPASLGSDLARRFAPLPIAPKSRPSSALDAKAFPLRSFQLDLAAHIVRLLVLTRIMQASDLVHCSICVTLFKSPQIKTLLPLCCLLAISCLLHCSVFKVQSPTFFKVRLKCSDSCPNTSIQSCGGGYRIRTGDPLLAKQVLYQLS